MGFRDRVRAEEYNVIYILSGITIRTSCRRNHVFAMQAIIEIVMVTSNSIDKYDFFPFKRFVMIPPITRVYVLIKESVNYSFYLECIIKIGGE